MLQRSFCPCRAGVFLDLTAIHVVCVGFEAMLTGSPEEVLRALPFQHQEQ